MFIKQDKTNWKLLLIAAVLAAIVGAGAFDFSRDFIKEMISLRSLPEMKWLGELAKSETAGWKIYKNEEYGFGIKYPKDWNYGPNILRNPQEPHMVFCPPEFSNLESGRGCKWYIQSNGLLNTSSPVLLFVEDWNLFKGKTKEEKKNIAWCKFEEKKTINNIEMEFIDCDGQKRVYWEDPDGAYLYKFFLVNSEFSTQFQQMLSTFRFLK